MALQKDIMRILLQSYSISLRVYDTETYQEAKDIQIDAFDLEDQALKLYDTYGALLKDSKNYTELLKMFDLLHDAIAEVVERYEDELDLEDEIEQINQLAEYEKTLTA